MNQIHFNMKSRCCGRCNGIDDICVADKVCDIHKIEGCELCFGERITEAETYNDMSEIEQKMFVSELITAMQNFPTAFTMAKDAIELAKGRKAFKDIRIGLFDIYGNKSTIEPTANEHY